MRALRLIFWQSIAIVVLLAALAVSNARAEHYTDCAEMGKLLYQLGVYRLQGYPQDLAVKSVERWETPEPWKDKYVYMVKWLYTQGAPPNIAKAEAVAYCKTGIRPVITRPKPPPDT